MRAWLVGPVALALASCAQEPITLQLNFPSQKTFLYSEYARVVAFDLGSNTLGDCARLDAEVRAGSTTTTRTADTGALPVCSFRDGLVTVPDMEAGPRAFVALVTDDANTPLLSGCAVADVYGGGPDVTIQLFMTDQYRTTATWTLTCSGDVDKCARGCR